MASLSILKERTTRSCFRPIRQQATHYRFVPRSIVFLGTETEGGAVPSETMAMCLNPVSSLNETVSATPRAKVSGRTFCVALITLGCFPLSSQIVIPAGARLSVRLDSEVSSRHSQPGDPVKATLIAPVRVNGKELLPSGFSVAGKVSDPGPAHKNSDHTVMRIGFGSLGGNGGGSLPFEAKVVSVDNARESVDSSGLIHGLRPLRRRPTEVEDILMLAAYAHPAVLGSLELGKFIVAEEEKPRVSYAPGIEMFLVLESPFRVLSLPAAESVHRVAALPMTPAFQALVNGLPLRTTTVRDVPSDLINCVFVGTSSALQKAFERAGWTPAEKLDIKTDTLTFLAIAGHHSYHEGPVSSLVVGGQKPSFVFEKAANTFAKRHHIRIWRQLPDFNGVPVWIGAGTHDTGIDFSRKERTFSHSVERDIDDERQKIEDDLDFTGDVSATALVPRPSAPQEFRNATGDQLHSDGAIAAIQLKPAAR